MEYLVGTPLPDGRRTAIPDQWSAPLGGSPPPTLHHTCPCAISGFDVTPYILETVKNGTTLAAIGQQGYLQGYLPAILARSYIDYELIPRGDILTGPSVINADNVDKAMAAAAAGRR